MNKFDELIELKSKSGFIYQGDNSRAVFAPDLGARIFCELNGMLLHRLDIDNVRKPNRPFNNYGGNNFWPAPEGGKFGFNYKADNWYVQLAINNEPFVLESRKSSTAKGCKETVLKNRKGAKIEVLIEREFTVTTLDEILAELKPATGFAYLVDDRISLVNNVKTDDALIACWTLEQFDASDSTISFVKVKQPQQAINFDFYSHPKDRIIYGDKRLFYKTDSKKRGQIGIKKKANPQCIGFYDLERKLICVREIVKSTDGLYFNIADNEQPKGPFSAMDNYSIFNGDEDLRFFELETIGSAEVQDGYLRGSHLTSKTSFAIFDDTEPIQRFIQSINV